MPFIILPCISVKDRCGSSKCRQIPCMIAFGKADLVQEEEIKPLQEIYQQAGYPCIGISTFENRDGASLYIIISPSFHFLLLFFNSLYISI